MRRLVVMSAVSLGCVPELPIVEPRAEAAPAVAIAEPRAEAAPAVAIAESLPTELRALGVAIDPVWAAAATIWVVAEFGQDTYPCRPGPDGSLDMILRDAFTPTRVLRGTLAARSIDVDAAALQGPSYPASLAPGRSYLLLLAPTPEIAARLADPEGMLSMYERLDRAQVVAVIDLSQSAAERASEQVQASPALQR